MRAECTCTAHYVMPDMGKVPAYPGQKITATCGLSVAWQRQHWKTNHQPGSVPGRPPGALP